jgi:hypothetical protein
MGENQSRTYLPLRPKKLRRNDIPQPISDMIQGYNSSLFGMPGRRIGSPDHDDGVRDSSGRSNPYAGDEAPAI